MATNNYDEDYNDVLYFKSLYPDSIIGIYTLVSDFADKLEYDGSAMYDQYPDRERIHLIAQNIHNNLNCPNDNQSSNPCCHTVELIEILIINEFLHRRIRRRAFL